MVRVCCGISFPRDFEVHFSTYGMFNFLLIANLLSVAKIIGSCDVPGQYNATSSESILPVQES